MKESICPILTRSVWLFDLDGTLVDSSDGVVRAFHYAQEQFHEKPADARAIRRSIGYPLEDAVAELTQISFDQFLPEFRKEAMATMHQDAILLPGVLSLLDALKTERRTIALVTAKRSDNARKILDHLKVAHHFSKMVGHGDTPSGKPDAAPVHHALKALGKSTSDAVLIGDTRIDIQCARAAGVPVVAIGSGYEVEKDLADADLFVHDAQTLKTRFLECVLSEEPGD